MLIAIKGNMKELEQDIDALRLLMIDSFHKYKNTHQAFMRDREEAWLVYVNAREHYLRNSQGKRYVPLSQTIIIPGPYSFS